MTLPNITHAQKLGHTPERRHITLLEALAQRGDALGGEFAMSFVIDSDTLAGERAIANRADTAELVVVQAARDKQ